MHNLTESTPAIKQWAYAWNAPRQAIESPLPTYEELHRRERDNAVLARAQELLQKQSVIVRMSVNAAANKLEKEQEQREQMLFWQRHFLNVSGQESILFLNGTTWQK